MSFLPPSSGDMVLDGPVPTPGGARSGAPAPRWSHIAALDGMRGVAVLAVLLFHAGHLTGGFLGVDLFFTLSGFLITSLLLDEARRTNAIDLVAFWGRRARRLLPAILVLLAVVVFVTWLIGSPAQLDTVHGAGPAALVYLANWYQIAHNSGYWASFDEASPLTHLWSLAIEEQFYVIWPLVFLGLWRLTRASEKAIAVFALVAATASATWMAVLYAGGDPTRVYLGTDTRAFSILFGAAMATIPMRGLIGRLIARHRASAQVVLGAVVVVGAIVWCTVDGASASSLFEGGLAAHALLGAVLIASCASDATLGVSRLFSGRALGYAGTRSYGLYLWHWPVFVALDGERTGLDGWPLTIVRFAVSFALAEISYRAVEMPIRRQTRDGWARGIRGALAMTGSIAAVALVYASVPDASAEIARFDPRALAAPSTAVPTATSVVTPSTTSAASPTSASAAAPAALAGSADVASTTTPPTTSPPTTLPRHTVHTVVFMGDSVAWDAGPGVEAALTAAGAQVEVRGYVGTGLVPTGAVDPLDLFLGELAATPRDLAVFQLSGWDLEFPEAEQRRAVRAFRDRARASGATMVFLLPPTVDPERYQPDYAPLLDEIARMTDEDPDGTILLDSTALWSTGYARDMNDDGIPERKPDGVHVCPSGAALLGNWLTTQLAARFDGLTPADPALWAGLPWVTDARYNTPIGVCS